MEDNTNNTVESIPYIVHESEVARLERIIKRLFIICIMLIVVAVGSNIAWLIYESQFEDVVTTVTQELDSGLGGTATINDGVHINGESKTSSNSKDEKTQDGR